MNKITLFFVFVAVGFLLLPGLVLAHYNHDNYNDYNNDYNNNYNYNYNNDYNNNVTCSFHAWQRCSAGNLYWFDSCGTQQDIAQWCQNGCNNNACQVFYNYNYNYNYTNYNNYGNGNCTYHAYKLCSGNNVYWYDSCGTQQDLFQVCSGANVVCKYGQCTASQPSAPVSTYIAHYSKKCYSNNVYWYDSLGQKYGLYQSCADSNPCTQDSCATGKCSNTLKCDGSTCATGSAEFNSYCASLPGGQATSQNQNQNQAGALSVSFFAKQDKDAGQWAKTAQANANSTIYFTVSVINNSKSQLDDVKLSVNIPNEISMLGNLQIDGVPSSGDIVAGVSIGNLGAGSAKTITFEGKTQGIASQAKKDAVVTVISGQNSQTDTVSINLVPGQAQTPVSGQGSGLWEFIKRWYLWILAGLVLIFLFIVVFRRLSSGT